MDPEHYRMTPTAESRTKLRHIIPKPGWSLVEVVGLMSSCQKDPLHDPTEFDGPLLGKREETRFYVQPEEGQMRLRASGPEIYARVRKSSDVFNGEKKQLVFLTGKHSGTFEGNTLKVRSCSDVQTLSDVALRFRGLALNVDGARLQAGNASQPNEELELTSTLRGLNILILL
jgi:hypothetical protein